LAQKMMDRAKQDVQKVENARRQIRSRKNGDKFKMAHMGDKHVTHKPAGNAAADRKIKQMVAQVTAKWDRVHKLSYMEQSKQTPVVVVSKTKQLEERIAALEAALKDAGGNIVKIEAKADTQKADEIKEKIRAYTAKLKSVEAKIFALQKIYQAAKKRKDKHNQIKSGTERQDLTVTADQIKAKLQTLYGELKVVNAATPHANKVAKAVHTVHKGKAGVKKGASTVGHIDPKAMKGFKAVKQQLKKVKKAAAKVTAQDKKRIAAMKEMTKAKAKLEAVAKKEKSMVKGVKKEKSKLKTDASALSKRVKGEQKQMKALKGQLSKQEKNVAKQQKDAKKKAAKVEKQLNGAKKAIAKIKDVAKKGAKVTHPKPKA